MFGRKSRRIAELEASIERQRQMALDHDRDMETKLLKLGLCMKVPLENRTPGMLAQEERLVAEIFPDPPTNPINGIRRVVGGHGYPVHYNQEAIRCPPSSSSSSSASY